MFGAGLLMLSALLAGYSIQNLPPRAILSLTGHLRARPDPWLEGVLRNAFTEFDRELSAVLHDRSDPFAPAGPARPAPRVTPGETGTPSSMPIRFAARSAGTFPSEASSTAAV